MRRLPVLAIAAALALAGCSASGGDDAADTTTTTAAEETTTTADEGPPVTVDPSVADLTEDDYVGAFTEQLTAGEGGNLAFDDETGECVARAWVDAVGVDALQEANVDLEDAADPDFDIADEVDLDLDTGIALAQAFPDCDADLIGEFARTFASDATEEQCMVDEIDPDAFYDLLGQTFGGEDDESLSDVLYDAASACGVEL